MTHDSDFRVRSTRRYTPPHAAAGGHRGSSRPRAGDACRWRHRVDVPRDDRLDRVGASSDRRVEHVARLVVRGDLPGGARCFSHVTTRPGRDLRCIRPAPRPQAHLTSHWCSVLKRVVPGARTTAVCMGAKSRNRWRRSCVPRASLSRCAVQAGRSGSSTSPTRNPPTTRPPIGGATRAWCRALPGSERWRSSALRAVSLAGRLPGVETPDYGSRALRAKGAAEATRWGVTSAISRGTACRSRDERKARRHGVRNPQGVTSSRDR